MKILPVKNNIEFSGASNIPSYYRAYVDKEIGLQIGSVAEVLRKLYPQLLTRSEEFLAAHGVVKVFNSLEKGVTFSAEDFNYIISLHENNALRLRVQNKISSEINSSIYVEDNQIAKTDTRYRIPEELKFYNFKENIIEHEETLKSILGVIDYKLLQLRKVFRDVLPVPQVEKLIDGEKLATSAAAERGVLYGLNLNSVNTIRSEFNSVYENLAKFKIPAQEIL